DHQPTNPIPQRFAIPFPLQREIALDDLVILHGRLSPERARRRSVPCILPVSTGRGGEFGQSGELPWSITAIGRRHPEPRACAAHPDASAAQAPRWTRIS